MEYFGSNGSCVFPLLPYQSIGCGGYGNIYAPTTLPTEVGCVDPTIATKMDCEDQQGQWLYPAITRSECEDYGDGCNEVVTFGAYLNFEITTQKNRQECKKCGGQRETLMKWQKGKWRESVSRPLVWKKRDYVQKFHWADTLSFDKIYSDVNAAVGAKFAAALRNEIQCRLGKVMELVEAISCDCSTGDRGETCFNNFNSEVPSGSVIVCKGEEVLLTVRTTLFHYLPFRHLMTLSSLTGTSRPHPIPL